MQGRGYRRGCGWCSFANTRLPTFNSLEADRPRVDSTQLKGCVRPQTFVDRHETFVTVCFETVHECLWTLERLEVSKRAFRGPGGKRPRSFWDPEMIRLNSKGCVRSWTVTNVCDRPRMFVDHPRMFVDRPRMFVDRPRMFLTVHESFVTGPQQKHSWTGPGPTIARDSTVYK